MAVTAGLTLAWSTGVTEGQIHGLKLVKRQGYGRAAVALLRQRVLLAAGELTAGSRTVMRLAS